MELPKNDHGKWDKVFMQMQAEEMEKNNSFILSLLQMILTTEAFLKQTVAYLWR